MIFLSPGPGETVVSAVGEAFMVSIDCRSISSMSSQRVELWTNCATTATGASGAWHAIRATAVEPGVFKVAVRPARVGNFEYTARLVNDRNGDVAWASAEGANTLVLVSAEEGRPPPASWSASRRGSASSAFNGLSSPARARLASIDASVRGSPDATRSTYSSSAAGFGGEGGSPSEQLFAAGRRRNSQGGWMSASEQQQQQFSSTGYPLGTAAYTPSTALQALRAWAWPLGVPGGSEAWRTPYYATVCAAMALYVTSVVASSTEWGGAVLPSLLSLPPTLALALKVLPALLLALAQGSPPSPAARALQVGLLASALGDGLLDAEPLLPPSPSTPPLFLCGLLSFACAHVAFALAFTRPATLSSYMPPTTLAARAASYALPALACAPMPAAMLVTLWPSLAPYDGPDMRAPVAFYTALIYGMMVASFGARGGDPRAAAPGRWLAMSGALLFALSDSILAIDRFYVRLEGAKVAVMITYFTAQALIAGSTGEPGAGGWAGRRKVATA